MAVGGGQYLAEGTLTREHFFRYGSAQTLRVTTPYISNLNRSCHLRESPGSIRIQTFCFGKESGEQLARNDVRDRRDELVDLRKHTHGARATLGQIFVRGNRERVGAQLPQALG